MVHHKVRLTDGGTNDWNNLQALCTECHSRLHAERGDYF
jgi:5-methylcytosine-specific restriction protein A